MINFPNNNNKTIRLDTSLGNHIDNSQILVISPFERNQFPLFEKWNTFSTLRTNPNPRYNCHGMTFANRRTGIYDPIEIQKILHEDDYQEIDKRQILPGDIIIYYSSDGDLEHSGVVITKPNDIGIPHIISKWGKYSEFIHPANNSPYDFSNVKFYRMK